MNDTELDEMLNQWDSPPVRAELREHVQAGFMAKRSVRRRWLAWPGWHVGKGVFAGVAVGAVLFLVVITQAFPQVLRTASPPAHVPWIVDSELIRYGDDGTSSVEMDIMSYKVNASQEVVLSRSVPGNPIKTLLGTTVEEVGGALRRFTTPFVISPDMLEKAKKMRSEHPGIGVIAGCGDGTDCLTLANYGFEAGNSCIAGKIVGHETILNHPTEAVRKGWAGGRMTVWTAPDLACFAMRVTYEGPQSNGTFKVVGMKQAVKITVNP